MFNLVVCGLAVATAALVLNITSVAIPYWYYYEEVDSGMRGSFYFGLWKVCIQVENSNSAMKGCFLFSDTKVNIMSPIEMEVVRALVIVAVLLMAFPIFIALLKIFTKSDVEMYMKVSGVIAFSAGIFLLVGSTVFAASSEIENLITIPNLRLSIPFKLHAGFALCIVSGVLDLVAGIMFLVDKGGKMRTSPHDTEQVPGHGTSQGNPSQNIYF